MDIDRAIEIAKRLTRLDTKIRSCRGDIAKMRLEREELAREKPEMLNRGPT